MTNFNHIRKALVLAHNSGNGQAINKALITGAEISMAVFDQWKQDVDALRKAVFEYVKLSEDGKHDDTIKETDVSTARNRIYPAWKRVLGGGETDDTVKELHASETDIEFLVGFATKWAIAGDVKVLTEQKSNPFRKAVETLVGWRMAANNVMTGETRKTLDTYYRAVKRIKKANDDIAAAETAKKARQEELDKVKDNKELADYIKAEISKLDDVIAAAADVKKKAEKKRDEVADAAKEIEVTVKKAEVAQIDK